MTFNAALFIAGLAGLILPGVHAPSIAGEAPVCDPGGPYGCYFGREIHFDGRGSYDPDGVIVSYTWDFGDGHTATGAQVTHAYQSVGTYTVVLVVVDNSNLTSQCEIDVRIDAGCEDGNCPPDCDAGGPYYGVTGTPIDFDSSGSDPVYPCIPLVYFEWAFGDGATAIGPQPSHSYSTPGVFSVLLTVTDADGAAMSCGTEAVITLSSAVDPATWGRIKHRWSD